MKARPAVFCCALSLLLAAAPTLRLTAANLLNESFEAYNRGFLDADMAPDQSPNSGTNGGANPWWGTITPNLRVVGAENGVTPRTGTNMVRGLAASGPADDDQDYLNLSFRCGGSNFLGNFLVDWWFYDPVGTTNADLFTDYLSIAYFTGMPTNADYIDPGNAGTQLQGLSLGAGDPTQGADNSFYQAQVYGVAAGSYDGNGWFNTATPRTNGWHHARIRATPVNGSGKIGVSFYIDDLANPTLTNLTTATPGFNCLQVNAAFGDGVNAVSAYYDDIKFYNSSVIAPPALNFTNAGGNLVLTFANSILQTKTNLTDASWVDLPGATSPYTNNMTGTQQFFRLKGL